MQYAIRNMQYAFLKLCSVINKTCTVPLTAMYGQLSILKLFFWPVYILSLLPPGLHWLNGWGALLICVHEIPGSYPGIQIYSNLEM